MEFLFMALFAGAIVVLDQLTKIWTVATIPLYGQIPVIDGLFHLTYVQNTGAAFSAFQGAQWLFLIVFAVLTVGILWEFPKKKLPFTTLERWCIVAIYAGGIGNMIDRLRLSYVIDMIEVEFMRFAVFNVADCFITCGAILLLTHLALFNKDFWKDEPKK